MTLLNERRLTNFLCAFLFFLAVEAVPLNFVGPELDVPEADLSGWSSCYRWRYSEPGPALSAIFANCSSPQYMFACGQIGTDQYDVVSSANRTQIIGLTPAANATFNDAVWYRANTKGIGFTNNPNGPNLLPCDIQDPGYPSAMCLRLDNVGNLIVGGRCSGSVGLNAGSTSFFREILFNPCLGKVNGEPCEDNNFCTINEQCINQECVGTLTTPPPITQCQELGECNPKTGEWPILPKLSGEPCTDGNPCTDGDACDGIDTCIPGTPVTCPAPPGQCYEAGVCNPGNGNCEYAFSPTTRACEDGLFCTVGDKCDGAGACAAGTNRSCISTVQCRDPGFCNEVTNQCEYPIAADGTECFLSNACVNTSVCDNGNCVVAQNVICPPVTQCQISAECNSNTGECEIVPQPDGTPCDDSDACTLTDTCVSGECVGTTSVVCSAIGPCYEVGTCNSLTGLCSNPFSPNTKPCTDGNACTDPDLCNGAGSCVPGPAVTCQAVGQCDVAPACNPAVGCVFTPKPNGTPCTDGDVCTLEDECVNGGCEPGALDLYNPYCFDDPVFTTGFPGDAGAVLPNFFDAAF